MKILVTGSDGQLGRELLACEAEYGFEMIGAKHSDIDIADPDNVKRAFAQIRPDIAVNAAAYTKVDDAENESALAFAVNGDGPANLAEVCAGFGMPLIHISTDFVFDGAKNAPYLETDPISPLNVYGKSKAAGEDAIASRLREHVIVRTSWLYSRHGKNFVKTMLKIGSENTVVKVVSDQIGSPTSATDLARAVLEIANAVYKGNGNAWGVFHFCNRGITSWSGFAEKIFEFASDRGVCENTRVKPISTDGYPTPAKRPAFSVLDCGRIAERFGIHPPPWEESLKIVVSQIIGMKRP